jgi:hypothetical protein
VYAAGGGAFASPAATIGGAVLDRMMQDPVVSSITPLLMAETGSAMVSLDSPPRLKLSTILVRLVARANQQKHF